MRLSIGQQQTYDSFNNREVAEKYKITCLQQKSRNPNPKYSESKRIYNNPAFYLPEKELEIWKEKVSKFRTKIKSCSKLQPGDIFKSPTTDDFYWHQFIEYLPQFVLPKSLLIKSLLLPYKVEAETYFDFNFKFLVVTKHHDLIIS